MPESYIPKRYITDLDLPGHDTRREDLQQNLHQRLLDNVRKNMRKQNNDDMEDIMRMRRPGGLPSRTPKEGPSGTLRKEFGGPNLLSNLLGEQARSA